MTIYSMITSTSHGRVYRDDGAAVWHCAASSGHEVWHTCDICGKRVVMCFECGSIDRGLTDCDCDMGFGRSHN